MYRLKRQLRALLSAVSQSQTMYGELKYKTAVAPSSSTAKYLSIHKER